VGEDKGPLKALSKDPGVSTLNCEGDRALEVALYAPWVWTIALTIKPDAVDSEGFYEFPGGLGPGTG